MAFKRVIESVMVEHSLSGEKIYDVLGGNITGAGKAVRADVAKLDSYSEGENFHLHIKWLDDKSSFAFKMYAPKELECFSDYEMEKFLLDSVNRSISVDLCDASIRSLGQLDYSWNNRVEVICSSVHDNKDYYQGLIKLLDGSHDGISSHIMHPQMARTLVQEGIMDLTPDHFVRFLPREEIAKSLKAYNEYVTNSFKNRFFDSSELGFDTFFKREYCARFMAEQGREAGKENGLSR